MSSSYYIMSLSRKLYFPKSLSFGAIRWSFLALASFIKRNSLRSFHSFSSCSPCASLHSSSSVHVPLRNLSKQRKNKFNFGQFLDSGYRSHASHRQPWLISPLANFESARGESILPTVLIVLRVENPVFVFFWSDVLLPLFLTVAVFTTQPTVIASLFSTDDKLHQFVNPSNGIQALGWIQGTPRQSHHFLGVVCRHVDLFAVLPNRVTGHFITPAMLLRLQPLLIKLIHIWN